MMQLCVTGLQFPLSGSGVIEGISQSLYNLKLHRLSSTIELSSD